MPGRFQIISILFRWKWHGTIKSVRGDGREGEGNKEGWLRGSEMGQIKEGEGGDERGKDLPSPHGDLCLLSAIKPPSYYHEYSYHVVSAPEEIEIIRRIIPRVPSVRPCSRSHAPKTLAQNIVACRKRHVTLQRFRRMKGKSCNYAIAKDLLENYKLDTFQKSDEFQERSVVIAGIN